MIEAREYLNFLQREYLGGFIRDGGAAVKFAIAPDADTTARFETALRADSAETGYVYASVDGGATKLSMAERVFHAIAAQVPWQPLAHQVVDAALHELRFPAPPDEPKTLDSIARHNRYDYQQLRKEFNRRLQEVIFRDYALTQEFRIAMILLCQAEISAAPDTRATADVVLQWLRGELRHISALRPELIYQKIARHNALNMLYSLGPWIRKAGGAGLVLHLDIRACAVTSKAQTEGQYYTRPAVLDVYELLRQFIDATDELDSTLIVVSAGPEFLTDPGRGVERYNALKLRISDEVRDRSRTNPYGSLIRLHPSAAPAGEVAA